MKSRLFALAALVVLSTAASAQSKKYLLTMTAVYTAAHSVSRSHPTYRVGEYSCTEGDEHNAPVCKTDAEWYEQDAMTGLPATAVFTLADGSHIGVQDDVYHREKGFLRCTALSQEGVEFKGYGRAVGDSIFCRLLGELTHMERTGDLKSGGTATFHYKLKGKPKDGYQFVEVEDFKVPYGLTPLGYDPDWLKK